MPKVYTADIRNLLDQAMQRFERESGLRASQNYPLFFNSLADEVNRETSASLKADTLYKHFYLRLRSFDEATIGYSWFYLDAISRYVSGKDYKVINPVLKNSYNDIKAAVKRVDYDMLKGSEDDPAHPEFPPNNPSFPATPTIPIQVDGFSNVWLKDESYNATGTHKDRMAWEIVIFYRNFLAKRALEGRFEKIPQLSLISSGCAAIAIQSQLRYYNLPSLKVIVDRSLDENTKLAMMKVGCEIYELDLHGEELDSTRILELTENENGRDLTFGEDLDFVRAVYYDWLSYEILNQSPDYCLLPFGSGVLFENLLAINRREIEAAPTHSKRFFGNIAKLRECHFLGATTFDRHSKLDKLYSPFSPALAFRGKLEQYIQQSLCGGRSRVEEVVEPWVERAIALAAEQHINCEPSGIAGLALLLQLEGEIPKDKKIVIVNTGRLKVDKFLGLT
ncbi:MAG: pyridoxal-phosphate dependent enzyme [Bacteroidota bacterium]